MATSSASSSRRREGLEPPPSRPTLATTHSELACLGEQIVADITEIVDEGNRSSIGDDFAALVARLLDVFNNVLESVSARAPYDLRFSSVVQYSIVIVDDNTITIVFGFVIVPAILIL